MTIKQSELETLLKNAFPNSVIEIKDLAGDDNHFAARICSSLFKGKNKVEQHQMVYNALKGKMDSELHALSITTEEK